MRPATLSAATLVLLGMTGLAGPLAAQLPQPLGPSLIVESAPDRVIPKSANAIGPAGDFLVIWGDDSLAPLPFDERLQGRRYHADATPAGEAFQIGIGYIPALVRQPNGRHVAVWSTLSPVFSAWILGRFLTAEGIPDGPTFVVTSPFGYANDPAISASRTSGDFVVAWDTIINPDTFVEAQRYSADGQKQGAPVQIATNAGVADVAVRSDGGFVVSWAVLAPGTTSASVARRYSADGLPTGPPRTLDGPGSGGAKLVFRDDGSLLAVWIDPLDRPTVQKLVGPELTPAGPPVRLSEEFVFFGPDLTALGDRAIATWVEADPGTGAMSNVFARELLPDGQPAGPTFRVTEGNPLSHRFPIVSANAAGRIVFSWTGGTRVPGPSTDEVQARLFQTATTCIPTMNRLCLNGGRFAVEALWRTVQGGAGAGTGVPLTDATGYFTFFNPNNVELVVKVLNACAPPFQRYWVFAAGLTNVEVDLTVIDTQTGEVAIYHNTQSTPFQPILATNAFATCP